MIKEGSHLTGVEPISEKIIEKKLIYTSKKCVQNSTYDVIFKGM